jgi:hypothetical protein
MIKQQKVAAHTLVCTELGREVDTIKNLRRIPGVVDIKLTYEIYDCLVRVEAPTPAQLQEIINEQIIHTDHIKSIRTLIERTDKDGPLGFKKGKNPDEFDFIHPSLK